MFVFIVNVEGAIHRDGKWLLILRSEKEEHAGGTLSLVGGKCEIEGGSSDSLVFFLSYKKEERESVRSILLFIQNGRFLKFLRLCSI